MPILVMDDHLDDLISTAQAAEMLGLSPRSIRRTHWDRVLCPVITPNRAHATRRYSRSAVARVAEARSRIAAEAANAVLDVRSSR